MSDTPDNRDIRNLPIFGGASSDPTAVPQLAPTRGPGQHLLAAASGGEGKPRFVTPLAESGDTESVITPTRESLDWELVDTLRKQVSNLLEASERANPGQTNEARIELARAHINEVVQAHVEDVVTTSGDSSAWSAQSRQAVAKAVLDSLFGLGRLQSLVDEEGVENIDIYGYDNIYVNYADGSFIKKAPIARSDGELLSELKFLASRGGESGRAFSATHPILDMDLPGGARLAAVHPPISPRPKAVIRIHRFIDISLFDLVNEQSTLTGPMAEFLSAIVRAGRSVVVSGRPKAGKTTLLRALASSIDPLEPIVTIEKERELYLHLMGDRHLIVSALQYRQGQGERTADGSMPGSVTLVDLIEEALRLNAERIFVGEVRGGEIDAMFQAMQAGAGSFSTIHAGSPTDAIERFATLMQRELSTTDAYAYRQISQHIDFIVQIRRLRGADGKFRRVVTDISEIMAGEGNRPIASPIFKLDRSTGVQVPVGLPSQSMLELLEEEGDLKEGFFQPGTPGREVA